LSLPDTRLSDAEAELLTDRALAALHHAAPVEPAKAVLLQHHRLVPVPSPAAQQVTPARVHGRAVADTAPGAQRARLTVSRAEIGRVGRIDEVLLVGGFDVVAHGDEGFPVVAPHHLESPVEALEQAVPHLAEMGHLPPAGPQGAGARQPVAFALCPHVAAHRLGKRRRCSAPGPLPPCPAPPAKTLPLGAALAQGRVLGGGGADRGGSKHLQRSPERH